MIDGRRGMMTRRTVAQAISSLALCGAAGRADAQDLKFQGPVKFYVGFAAGGQSDILARIIADKLKDRIGRAVVVDNKTGAAGRLAVEAVKTSPPDGSAFVLANISQMSVAPSIYKDLPYDALADFTAIGKVTDFQIALVTGKQTEAKTYAEAVAWLKANPGKANAGNPGSGSILHLYGVELSNALGVTIQAVPYRGGAPVGAALMQGEIALGWASVTDFIEQHRAGQLNIIAVTGATRSPQLPDVPTFAELSLPTLTGNGWIGLFGPAKLPEDIVAYYEREMAAVLADPVVREKLVSLGLIVAPSKPAEMAAQVKADLLKWKPIIEKAGITP